MTKRVRFPGPGDAGKAFDMSVTIGGTTKSLTGTLPAAAAKNEDLYAMTAAGSPVRELRPLMATVDHIYNSYGKFTHGYSPIRMTYNFLQDQDAVDRIIVADARDLHGFDTRAVDFYIGADVEVYEYVNGVRSLAPVHTTTITGGRFDYEIERTNSAQMVTGTTYTDRFILQNRDNVPYYFWIRGVAANGDLGPRSNVISITPTSRGTGADLIAQSPTTGLSGSIDNGLAVPTLSHVLNGFDIDFTAGNVGSYDGWKLYRSDKDPATHQGVWLDTAADGFTFRGHHELVVKRENTGPRRAWLANRLAYDSTIWANYRICKTGTITYVDDEPAAGDLYAVKAGHPLSASGQGSHHLEVDLRNAVTTTNFALGEIMFAGSGQTRPWFYEFLPVGTQLRFRCRTWNDTATTFNPQLPNNNTTTPIPTSTEWVEFVSSPFELTSEYTGSSPVSWKIDLPAGGLYRFASPTIEVVGETPRQFPSHVIDTGKCFLGIRTHQFIKSTARHASMDVMLNGAGDSTPQFGNTIPQFLECLALLDLPSAPHRAARRPFPHWQFERFLSNQELLDFMEYMCAPAGQGHSYADLRLAQGFTDPPIDTMAEFHFEPGNEGWNTGADFGPGHFIGNRKNTDGSEISGGAAAGTWYQRMVEVIKSSPWYAANASKFKFWAGCRATAQDFTTDCATAFTDADYVSVASYHGGFEPGVSQSFVPTQDYTSVWRMVNYASPVLTNVVANLKTWLPGRTFASYEGGPGHRFVDKASDALQSRMRNSVAEGTGALHAFLRLCNDGYVLQNQFLWRADQYWLTDQPLWRNGQRAAPAQWMYFLGTEGFGDLYSLNKINNALQTIWGDLTFEQRTNTPEMDFYLAVNGTRMVLYVFNLTTRFDQADPVLEANTYDAGDTGARDWRFVIPASAATSMARWEQPQDPLTNNYDVLDVADAHYGTVTLTETAVSVPATTGGLLELSGTIPAAKVQAFVLDGVTSEL